MKRSVIFVSTLLLQAQLPLAFLIPSKPLALGLAHPPTVSPSIAKPPHTPHTESWLLMAEPTSSDEQKSKLPFFLDPGTKGGALFLSLVLFAVPIVFYNIILSVSDVDELDLGRWIGVGFTAVATVAWLGTYLFRVVTKDMTYVSGGMKVCVWHESLVAWM